MKKRILMFTACLFLATAVSAMAKTYDLVLVHGLTNKHHWSDSFLSKCAEKWGSKHVFVIYTNTSTRLWTRVINGRTIYFCGENDFSAGDDYIWDQAELMRTKIVILQRTYGLTAKFDIIAHSMGGLVSRYYIWDYPNTVAGLVTLGTPHQGSSLAVAADFMFLDWFIGAEHAMDHLKPAFVKNEFNVYIAPVAGMPFADGGKMYTVTGDADGYDCWGWGGELFAGYPILLALEGDNDGLVSHTGSKISGASCVATFWDYDHYDLVLEPSVADLASSYLR